MAKRQQIWLSPTRLAAWYSLGCPQRWKWESDFSLIKPEGAALDPMERGTLVHALLEGKVPLTPEIDSLSRSLYERLLSLRRNIVQDILIAEQLEQFKLGDYAVGDTTFPVMWKRKIDCIARLSDGTLAIVDYKTTGGYGWKTVGETGIAPQSMGFQSMGYLVPPKKLPKGIKQWPTTVLYLIAGFRGPATVQRVDYSDEAMAEFHKLVGMAVRAMAPKEFPKVHSKQCVADLDKGGCPLMDMCFQTPGWEAKYKKRERE